MQEKERPGNGGVDVRYRDMDQMSTLKAALSLKMQLYIKCKHYKWCRNVG